MNGKHWTGSELNNPDEASFVGEYLLASKYLAQVRGQFDEFLILDENCEKWKLLITF